MEKKYVFLDNYALRLIEKSKCSPSIGLWDGKMGIAINILHISKTINNERYLNEAYELIDSIYESIHIKMPLGFENGLSGIGCGFQYIISNGFVDADSDEVLSEIDSMIKTSIENRSLVSLSFAEGVSGIAYYLYHRLKGRQERDYDMVVLKLKEYLIYLIDWIESLIIQGDKLADLNDAYFILCRLHKLDVFNHKTNKLIDYCIRKLTDFNIEVMDFYDCLGIQSLKILKPWLIES